MTAPDLLWHWLGLNDHHAPAISFALPFLMSGTLGAMLASLVTWIEGVFAGAEE
jgi:hypothetical protein